MNARLPPTKDAVREWVIIKPKIGKIVWRKDVPKANRVKGASWQKGESAVYRYEDHLVVSLPKQRWIKASHLIWLARHGEYPVGAYKRTTRHEENISPRNGIASDLRMCNWVLTSDLLAERLAVRMNIKDAALKREAAKREALGKDKPSGRKWDRRRKHKRGNAAVKGGTPTKTSAVKSKITARTIADVMATIAARRN